MMMEFFLLGGLLLAWSFGRNNFGNIFGTAVGTGILSFRFATFLTGAFLLLGALLNGSGTSETISSLAYFPFLKGACFFSIIVALIMIFLTKWGIPASVAQISIGALVGWNLALDRIVPWDKVIGSVLGWFYSPLIACLFAFLIFNLIRFYLKKWPIPILYRDIWVRFFWIIVGSFSAYSLGANNLPVLTIPFVSVTSEPLVLFVLFSLFVWIGCLMASKKIIKMVSSQLFPLSSVEGLIVSFSAAMTLLLFSFQKGLFPALPISMSASLIGAIVGISLGKGGAGLKIKSLFSIIISWILAPLFSGLLCFAFISIMDLGGF